MYELEIIHHRKMEGVSLFINTVDFRTAHFHGAWELVWILENPLHVVCEQQECVVMPNEIFLMTPNTVHEFRKEHSPCTFLCLQVDPEVLGFIHNTVLQSPWLRDYMDEAQTQTLCALLRQLAKSYLQGQPFFQLESASLICRIFHEILTRVPSHRITAEEARLQEARNARLERLLRFVDENYMHRICLTDFAKAEGCSMSYLSHFVKAALNQSFQEYVNLVRYHCACKLIKSGQAKMLDVCMAAGFSDYRYFVKAFRKLSGMTPVEYSRRIGTFTEPDQRESSSLHSSERYYSYEKSLEIIEKME